MNPALLIVICSGTVAVILTLDALRIIREIRNTRWVIRMLRTNRQELLDAPAIRERLRKRLQARCKQQDRPLQTMSDAQLRGWE